MTHFLILSLLMISLALGQIKIVSKLPVDYQENKLGKVEKTNPSLQGQHQDNQMVEGSGELRKIVNNGKKQGYKQMHTFELQPDLKQNQLYSKSKMIEAKIHMRHTRIAQSLQISQISQKSKGKTQKSSDSDQLFLQSKQSKQKKINVTQSQVQKFPATVKDQKQKEQPKPAINETPKKQVVNREFSGIGLYHDIPLSFRVGEIYRICGIVEGNKNQYFQTRSGNLLFVNIVFSEWGTDNEFRCTQQLKDKQLEFTVSCKMSKSGIYYLSIFAGQNGFSSYRIRNIRISSVSDLTLPAKQTFLKEVPKAQGLVFMVKDNQLELRWNSIAPITNLSISQQKDGRQLKKEFLLSNYHQFFRVPYAEFLDFSETKTHVQICHAKSDDGTLYKVSSPFGKQTAKNSFNAFKHAFDDKFDEYVSLSPEIPWKLDVGEKFKFDAIFGQDVRRDVYLVQPNNNIKKFAFKQLNFNGKLPQSTFKAKTPLTVELSFSMPGTHIIEINSVSGMALVNQPIYIGNGEPLLPDYQDFVEQHYNTGEDHVKLLEKYVEKTISVKTAVQQPNFSSTLQKKRQYLLQLLNILRQQYGVQNVKLSEELNTIAQYHSDDMNKNNYFSHTSLNGDGPPQQALRFNFPGPVGENIAQSNSLTEGHLGLKRSAGHLENSVDGSWTRVGIGISITNMSQYIIAFQFSTRDLKKQPLTKLQLEKARNDLVNVIKELNPSIKQQDQNMSSDITSWMSGPRNISLFQQVISKRSVYGPMRMSIFEVSFSKNWTDRLRESAFLSGYAQYSLIGVGIKIKQDSSLLESYIIFS